MTEAEIMKALYYMYCATAYKDTITMDKETAIGIYDLINRGKMYSEIKAEARAEAIKEFAERVKARGCNLEETGGFLLETDDLDQIAKEMIGE